MLQLMLPKLISNPLATAKLLTEIQYKICSFTVQCASIGVKTHKIEMNVLK